MHNQLQTSKDKLDSYYQQNYVELADPENLGTGRRIFINKAENKAYQEIISNRHNDFNFYYIYKQIVSLKNLGYLQSLVSKMSMASRVLPIEGGQIRYSVWHSKIYIDQIQIQSNYKFKASGKNIPAGVYQVKESSSSAKQTWKPVGLEIDNIKPQNLVNTKNLAINGQCKDILDASNFMPNFIKFGHGDASLGSTYALFFNPNQGGLGSEWRSFVDSSGLKGGTQSAKKLAEVLMQSAGKTMKITVQGDGHSLFKQALKIVAQNGHSLKEMTVFYANSTENLTHVDHWRKKTEMQLAAKAPLINATSVRQNLTSGNIISQSQVAYKANSSDAISIVSGTAMAGIGMVGLASIGTGLLGAAGWTLGVAPLLLGQSKALNKEVIDSPQKAIQQGAKHYKKVVWDPVHKMMVRS